MTTKNLTTAALILAAFALVGGAVVPTGVLVPTPTAYAQLSDVGGLLDEPLQSLAITEEEEELEDTTIDQPVGQEVGQEVVNQSEENEQDDDSTQIQTGADDQDTAQGIVDGNDLAESSLESGDSNKKYSSSSFSDAEYRNEQGADNDGELNQAQDEDVDQDHATIFADDTADLDDANVGVPIAVPINVQEELEEVLPPDEEPPVDEEELIAVCIQVFLPGGEEEFFDRLLTEEEIEALEALGIPVFRETCEEFLE